MMRLDKPRYQLSEAAMKALAKSMGHMMYRGKGFFVKLIDDEQRVLVVIMFLWYLGIPPNTDLAKTRVPEPLHAFLNEVLKRFMQLNKV